MKGIAILFMGITIQRKMAQGIKDTNLKSYYTLLLKTRGFWQYFEECKENGNAFHFPPWGAFYDDTQVSYFSIEVDVKNMTLDSMEDFRIYFV